MLGTNFLSAHSKTSIHDSTGSRPFCASSLLSPVAYLGSLPYSGSVGTLAEIKSLFPSSLAATTAEILNSEYTISGLNSFMAVLISLTLLFKYL